MRRDIKDPQEFGPSRDHPLIGCRADPPEASLDLVLKTGHPMLRPSGGAAFLNDETAQGFPNAVSHISE